MNKRPPLLRPLGVDERPPSLRSGRALQYGGGPLVVAGSGQPARQSRLGPLRRSGGLLSGQVAWFGSRCGSIHATGSSS